MIFPEEANDVLRQRFDELQRQWEIYKKSSTAVRNHREATNAVKSPPWLDLEEWGPLDDVRAIEEIVRERRASIKSGRLKGRCLLEALDEVAAEDKKNENEEEIKEISSINCSSELIQESNEVRGSETRSCCTTSEDGTAGKVEGEEEIEIELSATVSLRESGRTCLVSMARWFFLFVVVAIGFISLVEFYGDQEDWYIPPT